MDQINAVDHVEMRAMRATIRDGITEMQMGTLLMSFGVVFSFAPPFGIVCALLPFALYPLGKLLKRRFVYPRIGYAKAMRQPHAVRGILIAASVYVAVMLSSLGVFSWVLGFDRGASLWLSHFVPALVGVMMAIGPWVVARTYRLMRWYVFAGLFVLGGICLPLFNIATGYAAVALEVAIVGGLALVYGIVLFLSFLRGHTIEESARASD
ncbi:hypothetical protein ACFLSF_00095 [Candidatus Bipolaricaulota bacterium]